MLVSSLVLTTDSNAHDLLPSLVGDERIAVGVMKGRFLPLVATTASLREARELTRELQRMVGVRDLQLVAWFEESALGPSPSSDDFIASSSRMSSSRGDEDEQELP